MFKFTRAICVFTLSVAALCAQTNMPLQVTHTSGLVGLAEGQTARFNALNPEATTGAACSGLLSFIGDDGAILKTKTVSVAAGTGQHVDLDSVIDLALPIGVRRDIRATITVAAAPATGTSATAVHAACRLIGTLEIFNTIDGRTLVSLGTEHRVPEPGVTPGT
jgi:hypothetical protein